MPIQILLKLKNNLKKKTFAKTNFTYLSLHMLINNSKIILITNSNLHRCTSL